MPNYSLILDAKFKPFSYQEMLAPVMAATQAHQAIEEEYGNLAAKASVWEEMANEQTDPYAYKMYKTYSNDLEEQANQLAKEGLNPASRRGMLNMRSRYSKEIVPIENAYKARAEEIKEQLAGRAQGMVYEGDASTTSLDRYIKDPSIKFRYANSQEGYKRVLSAADALSKELRQGLESIKVGRLDPYTKTWLQQHGYQSSEIAQAIADIEGALRGDGNARGTNVLTSILANEMQTAGVNDWNINSKMDYYNRIAPALYKAVGQTNVGTFEDYEAKLAAQEESQIRIANLKNGDPSEEGGSAPLHWEGVLGKRDYDSELYQKLLSEMTINGRSLRQDYFGKTFNNPMAIYREALEYSKKHPVRKDPSFTEIYQGSVGARSSKPIDYSFENAVEVMKKKYGVSKVLTPEKYEAMQRLGFDESSTFEDMNGANMANAINISSQLSRPTSLNMAEYGKSADLIRSNMKKGDIVDIETGDKVKYDDIKDSDIIDVAVSDYYPERLLVMTEDRVVSVPASYHSAEALRISKLYNSMSVGATLAQKADLQDLSSMELEELFNNYEPVRSKTSSRK